MHHNCGLLRSQPEDESRRVSERLPEEAALQRLPVVADRIIAQAAQKAVREADRAEVEAWSVGMEGYGGPAQPSPTIGQCIDGGLKTTPSSLSLNAIRGLSARGYSFFRGGILCPFA
jgi:hypothetical protein